MQNSTTQFLAAAGMLARGRLSMRLRRAAVALGILMFAGIAVGGVAPYAAYAATLQVNAAGVLTGALKVDVEGDLFDIVFVDGSCASVFSGCDTASDLDVTSSSRAVVIGAALRDQVFIDGALGAFDSDPTRTLGCSTTTFGFCQTLIPTEILSGVLRRAIFVKNEVGVGGTQVFGNTFGVDFSRGDITFARLTPSAVPLPPALPLMAAALVLPFWFRRRQASARRACAVGRSEERCAGKLPCVR